MNLMKISVGQFISLLKKKLQNQRHKITFFIAKLEKCEYDLGRMYSVYIQRSQGREAFE